LPSSLGKKEKGEETEQPPTHKLALTGGKRANWAKEVGIGEGNRGRGFLTTVVKRRWGQKLCIFRLQEQGREERVDTVNIKKGRNSHCPRKTSKGARSR